MSIREELAARCEEGRLRLVPPLLPGRHDRVLYVVEELHEEILAAAVGTDSAAYRVGQLLRDFDRFSSGGHIVVGYRKENSCFMKPLDPIVEEVWEIRSRDPRPALRVFGRFAEQDVFVVTHKVWRHEIADNQIEWDREIRRCKAIWRQLFPTYPPLTGSKVSDYFSGNFSEVGHRP